MDRATLQKKEAFLCELLGRVMGANTCSGNTESAGRRSPPALPQPERRIHIRVYGIGASSQCETIMNVL